jgi:glutaredoxin
MFSFFHLFVKVDCPYCKDAISLLEKKGLQFVVTVVDKSENYFEMVKSQFNHHTVPVVLDCDNQGKMELVGGFTELEKHFNKSNKKRK